MQHFIDIILHQVSHIVLILEDCHKHVAGNICEELKFAKIVDQAKS